MPRHNSNQNQSGRHCKIRKRVSSSSSSSSVVKNYRFKRAILVGKSAGSTTPVPTWKLIMAGSESPLQRVLQNFENNGVKYAEDGSTNYNNHHHHNQHNNSNNNNKGKEALSARKLAATLWEINGLHSPAGLKEEIFEERPRGRKNFERVGKLFDADPLTPVCDQIDGSTKVGGHRRRSSATSQKLQITEYIAGVETVGKANSIEVGSQKAVAGENIVSIKTRLKDVNNSLIASKELVKVLHRMLSQEEQNSSRITLVSALRVELDRARRQMDKIQQEQRCNGSERDALLKQFAEEKAAWKSRERERIREAVSALAREHEIERKLRRQAERLNKKLGKELAETKGHFSRAMKELECEKRGREILEQTFDELARGIGEERVEVEELKRESVKAREEVERERQMLQLADVLREERVQMKLAEARYEYEEKNADLERLKTEIQTYLKTKQQDDGAHSPHLEGEGKTAELQDFLRKMQNGQGEEVDDGEGDSGDSSELHSIELNMENNRSYKWSFACEGNTESRRASMDEVFKGRRSLSDKIQWESICLQKNTSNNGFGKLATSLEIDPGERNEEEDHDDNDDELKRFNPGVKVKSQRLGSCQGSASPAFSTGNSSCLREACTAILQDLASRREQLQLEGGQSYSWGTKI